MAYEAWISRVNDKPKPRRRLGHYDYNRDENPLPERERKWRDLERQKLFKKFADEKEARQKEAVELDPTLLGSQFSAVFAQLAGSGNKPVSTSTIEELDEYCKKLSADMRWIDALMKELQKEYEFLLDLRKWMERGATGAEGGESPRMEGTDDVIALPYVEPPPSKEN